MDNQDFKGMMVRVRKLHKEEHAKVLEKRAERIYRSMKQDLIRHTRLERLRGLYGI